MTHVTRAGDELLTATIGENPYRSDFRRQPTNHVAAPSRKKWPYGGAGFARRCYVPIPLKHLICR